VLPFLTEAQTAVLKNFNTRNGLPSNEIYFLHHDKKGYIWICSDAGLVKYNGNNFKTFDASNGLPDNTVFEVKEDKKGRIWYRTFSGKLGFILNDTVHVISANEKIIDFIKDGIVCSFAIDNDILYVGKRNTRSVSFLKIEPPYTSNKTSEIWKDDQMKVGLKLVMLNEDFVYTDSRSTKAEKKFNMYIYDKQNKLLVSDDFGVLKNTLFIRVFGTGQKIFLLANEQLKTIDLRTKMISTRQFETPLITIMQGEGNALLIGERLKGVTCIYPDNKPEMAVFDGLLKGYTFTYAVKDYQGGYWFSTLEAGVFYMPSQNIKSLAPFSDFEPIVHSLAVNDSSLISWYVSGRTIMTTVGTNTSTIKLIANEKGDGSRMSLIHPLNTNEFIFVRGSSSYIKNITSGKTTPCFLANGAPLTPRFVIKVRNKLMCLGLNAVSFTDRHSPELLDTIYHSKDRITAGVYDSVNNKIYLGGLRGLYNFTHSDITEKNRILETRIEDLKISGNTLYIATNAQGILIKNGNSIDTINEKKGLISNICKSITLRGNVLWVSTNKGISKIIFKTKNEYDIFSYPLNSFLDASSTNEIFLLRNKACFNSGNKIYTFDTDVKPAESRLYLTSLRANSKDYDPDANVMLKYSQSDINITYEGLFYNVNRSILYRYKINRGDNEWNYTTETNLNFPSLSQGEYEFIVEAKNNQGEWIKADKKITFSIDKPFWQKIWFIALEIVVMAALLVLALRYRYVRILKKEREKNDLKVSMYELETKAVKAQMNPHFIFNSLNSIQQFILGGDNENAYRYLAKFSKLVRKLLESNTSDTITLEDEIDLLKRYIEIEALRFESVFKYEIEVDERLNMGAVEIPHLLVQPFIENAIWHGLLQKKGDKKLKVSFAYINEKCLNCVVEDNGVGRNFKKPDVIILKTKQSLAIEFIKQRLELLQKTKNINCGFEFIDKKDEQGNSTGTKVTITIPILTPNESKSNYY
jgi:hypothetical protein